MNVEQKKNITLTVIAAILFMAAVLALFINKITTPRYLSNIELKINDLVLLDEPITLQSPNGSNPQDAQWLLLTHNAEQEKAANALVESLPKKIASLTVVSENTVDYPSLDKENIFIVNTDKVIMAYFKPSFDRNKMKLTYSSVFTHR